MKNFLFYIIKSLVNNPDEISINEIEQDRIVILELKVAKEDIGRVIGKEGKIIRTIRTLINAASLKIGKKVIVEVLG